MARSLFARKGNVEKVVEEIVGPLRTPKERWGTEIDPRIAACKNHTHFHELTSERFEAEKVKSEILELAMRVADEVRINTGMQVTTVPVKFHHWTHGRGFGFLVIVNFKMTSLGTWEPEITKEAVEGIYRMEKASTMFLN